MSHRNQFHQPIRVKTWSFKAPRPNDTSDPSSAPFRGQVLAATDLHPSANSLTMMPQQFGRRN